MNDFINYDGDVMIYRKKPVEVEAIYYNGKNAAKIINWSNGAICDYYGSLSDYYKRKLKIETLEGILYIHPGDFIVKGVNGEYYPCKSDIFWKTYERGGMMIKRYTEIDQPNAVYEWGMKEDKEGDWVKYDDIKHLLERSDNSDYARGATPKSCTEGGNMKIKKMLVDGVGWVYATDGEIEPYNVNGEMAIVKWYRQTNKNGEIKTFNGKYIVSIEYFANDRTTANKQN